MPWNGQKKRIFREALLSVYRDFSDLKMFLVDHDLQINLAQIPTEPLETAVFELIQQAEGQGYLDELFETFCQENANNPTVEKDISELTGDRFIDEESSQPKISSEDWKQLFSCFLDDDPLAKACKGAFRYCFQRPLEEIYPDCPSLNQINTIQQVLEKYDNPEVAIAFANRTYQLIQSTCEGKERDGDLENIQAWRDRVAQQYNISPDFGIENKHGYLLVAIVPKPSHFLISPELHLTNGQIIPIDIYKGVKCQFDEVPNYLSEIIKEAEKTLLQNYQGIGSVTLEIFLPWQYLDRRIHEWPVTDELEDRCNLSEHRAFIVRSLERARKPGLQLKLKKAWRKWEECLQNNQIVGNFYELDCSNCTLYFDYSQQPGIKFGNGLPEGVEKRQKIFKQLIKSCVPFAFWTYQQFNWETTMQALNALLDAAGNLQDFQELASAIMRKRNTSPNSPISELGMLCDCPERMPTLSDAKTSPLRSPS